MDILKPLRKVLGPRSYSYIWDWAWRLHGRKAILSGVNSPEQFEESGKKDAERLQRIIPRGSVVLDFGCGIGRLAKHFTPFCKQLYCADASSIMLREATRYLAGYKNIEFTRIKGADLPYPDEFFDAVVSLLVLQHMAREDAYRYMQEFYRVLKPGGIAVLQFPNLLSQEYWQAFLEQVAQPSFLRSIARTRPYTIQEVEWKLKHAGFRVEQVEERGAEIITTAIRI